MVEPDDRAVRYAISERVLSQSVHDDIVVLDLQSEQYFGLNAVGALVWNELTDGKTLGPIHAAIVERYDVAHDQAWSDLEALVTTLLERGLIHEAS